MELDSICFKKRQHEILSQHQADLFRVYSLFCARGLVAEGFQHHVKIITVVFQLCALLCIEYILQHERMKVEASANLLYRADIAQAVKVDPFDTPGKLDLFAQSRGGYFGFAYSICIIIQQGNAGSTSFLCADMHQCSWWQSCFCRSLSRV